MSLKVVDSTKSPEPAHKRNPGYPLDLDWVERVRMNRSALERRAGSIGARRTVKKDYQLAWLLKAITLIDLTTLNADDTAGRVERLCAKARNPLRADILEKLDLGTRRILPGAVCVYHNFVSTAVDALEGTGIPVAAVSTAFPHGLAPVETKIAEIEASVRDGEFEAAGFGDYRGVGGIEREGVFGALAPKLLVGNKRDDHIAGEAHLDCSRRSDQDRREATLHVEGTTTVETPVPQLGGEAVTAIGRGSDGVQVTVEHEGSASTGAAGNAHNRRAICVPTDARNSEAVLGEPPCDEVGDRRFPRSTRD